LANRFEIERTAGSGGMGTVYRAHDHASGQVVALKLLRSDGSSLNNAQRFAREVQFLSELRHPGIVSHLTHGQTAEGCLYLAMEWLEGQNLAQRLTQGPLPLRDSILLLGRVAEALDVAHKRGIIHRDRRHKNKIWLRNGDIAGCQPRSEYECTPCTQSWI
jgi:serine/threonine protein kinase